VVEDPNAVSREVTGHLYEMEAKTGDDLKQVMAHGFRAVSIALLAILRQLDEIRRQGER
jgi:hypothetical protein